MLVLVDGGWLKWLNGQNVYSNSGMVGTIKTYNNIFMWNSENNIGLYII